MSHFRNRVILDWFFEILNVCYSLLYVVCLKPVPRSESMIYGLKRSDTFIRQENMEVTNNDDDDDSVFMLVVPQIKTLTSHAATMLNASRQIREAVTDMESLIEGLTKQVKLQKVEIVDCKIKTVAFYLRIHIRAHTLTCFTARIDDTETT